MAGCVPNVPDGAPMLLGGGAVVLAITAYHGPRRRSKQTRQRRLGLTLFGARQRWSTRAGRAASGGFRVDAARLSTF